MKLMNKYIRKSLVLAVIAAAGFAMISCEDEPDKYEVAGGVPTVRYIRSPKASASDSLIVAATTGSSICLVGVICAVLRNCISMTKRLFSTIVL